MTGRSGTLCPALTVLLFLFTISFMINPQQQDLKETEDTETLQSPGFVFMTSLNIRAVKRYISF